jgi:hypothetical protein
MGKPRGSVVSATAVGAAVGVDDGAAAGIAVGARPLPPQAVAIDSATIRISSAVLRKFIRRSRQRLCRA